MKRILAASFALMLLLALAACGNGSGGGGGGGGACPNPAQFDHAGCAFDDAGTLFGP